MRGIVTGDQPAMPRTGELPGGINQNLRTVETQTIDSGAPTVHILEDLHGRGAEAVENWKDTKATTTNNGGDGRIEAAWQNGRAPGRPGATYTMPGKTIVEGMRELPKDAYDRLMNGLMAADVRWTIDAGRGNPSKWKPSQLKAMIDELESPQLKPYVEAYRTHMKEIAREMHDANLISKAQLEDFETRPYVPNIRFDANKTTREGFANLWFNAGENRFANSVNSPFMRYRAGDVMDFVSPDDALGIYEKSITQQILENRARRSWLRLYTDGLNKARKEGTIDELFPNGIPVRRARKGETGRIMQVFENGEPKNYVVGDSQLHQALQFAPHAVLKSMSDIRQLAQMGITGDFNPLFAPSSLAIDGFFGSLNVSRNEVAGYFDSQLHKAGIRDNVVGDVLSAAVRPIDTLGTMVAGVGRGIADRAIEDVAVGLTNRLMRSELAGEVPSETLQWAANRAVRAFHKTMSYQMREYGYAPGMLTSDFGESVPTLVQKFRDAAFGDTTVFARTVGSRYRGVLNAVRDGYRLQFYAQTYAKLVRDGMDPSKANRRATRLAREIGSDPTKAGQGKYFTQTISSMPYANIGIQSLGQLNKTMIQDKNASAYLTVASHAAWSVAAASAVVASGGGEWWYERTPDRVRARMLPLNPRAIIEGDDYVFDENDVILVDVGPEIAALRSMPAALLESLLGLSGPETWRDPGFQSRTAEVSEALLQLQPFGIPQGLNVLAEVVGGVGGDLLGNETLQQVRGINTQRFSRNQGVFGEPQSDTGLLRQQREFGANTGIMNDRMASFLNTAVGTAGATIADSVEQYEGFVALNPGEAQKALDSVLDRRWYQTTEAAPASTILFGGTRTPTRNSPVVQKGVHTARPDEAVHQAA